MPDIRQAVTAEIPWLRRYARKLARDDTLAEDLVQECLARGLGRAHLWQEGTNLRAWLCTILHNHYVSEIRRAIRKGIAVDVDKLDEVFACALAQEAGLQSRDVSRAFDSLTAGQRALVVMIGIDGLD